MVLSSKVAFLTCLAFVSGMCWLIKQVARPVVELPAPLVVRGPEAAGATPALASSETSGDALPRARNTPPHRRFELPSPVTPGANHPATTTAVVAATSLGRSATPGRPVSTLPPPVVDTGGEIVFAAADIAVEPAAAGEGDAPSLTLAEPTRGEPPASEVDAPLPPATEGVPVAVVTGEPAHPTRLLAAIAPRGDARPTGVSPGKPPAAATHYTVRRGDTLVRIMRRHWKTDDPALLRVLVAANPRIAARRDRIYPGDVLTIPALEVARAMATRKTQEGAEIAAAKRPQRGVRQVRVRWYTVRRRDSLVSIARRMLKDERRWREIAALNGLRNANKLRAGARIKLPVRSSDT